MPDDNHTKGIKSTASIAGHPIHPMLIPFPIASLVGALITDITYTVTQNAFWADASFWLLLFGVGTALLAAVFGLTDFVTIRRVREHRVAWVHLIGNLTAVALAFANIVIRWEDHAEPIIPAGIILSIVIVGLLGITGWAGGDLVYRHMIGVNSPDRYKE